MFDLTLPSVFRAKRHLSRVRYLHVSQWGSGTKILKGIRNLSLNSFYHVPSWLSEIWLFSREDRWSGWGTFCLTRLSLFCGAKYRIHLSCFILLGICTLHMWTGYSVVFINVKKYGVKIISILFFINLNHSFDSSCHCIAYLLFIHWLVHNGIIIY